MSANKLLVCPYDEAHKVKSTRMQLHITRCRLNHLNETKFICPFNATHVMSYQERDYHLLHCSDKAPLDRILAESLDKNNPFKGRTAVPSYSEALPFKPDEVWDVDEESSPTPGYLPNKERPSGAVVQPALFLGASVKRNLYQELHHQSENTDFKLYSNSSSIPGPIPRQPKQLSKASMFEIERGDFPCLGLGRGKTLGSRISANICSPPVRNQSTIPVRSYSLVVSNKMNDTRINTTSIKCQCDVTAALSHNDPQDFLHLGFGRGKIRNVLNHDS